MRIRASGGETPGVGSKSLGKKTTEKKKIAAEREREDTGRKEGAKLPLLTKELGQVCTNEIRK